MHITYDEAKNQANIAKHGVDMALANSLEWETLMAIEDNRREYGEPRMIGYALMGERLFNVIFVDRGNARRIISLRKANNREKKHYVLNY